VHVAVVADTERGIDPVLADAVSAVRGSCGSISIVAVCEPARICCGIGFPGAGLATSQLRDGDRVYVAELGRRLVARLPDDVCATHAGFLGWSCPELLRFLRGGSVDRVIFAARPFNPLTRWTLMRASKSIGA
jgi:hypothetical protein